MPTPRILSLERSFIHRQKTFMAKSSLDAQFSLSESVSVRGLHGIVGRIDTTCHMKRRSVSPEVISRET